MQRALHTAISTLLAPIYVTIIAATLQLGPCIILSLAFGGSTCQLASTNVPHVIRSLGC